MARTPTPSLPTRPPAKQKAESQSHVLLLAELSAFLHTKLAEVLKRLGVLERKMSLQDEKIAAFKASMDAKLAALGSSLDGMAASQSNIAADEKRILDQLAALSTSADLSPENSAVLDNIIAAWGAVVDRSAAQATSLQELADSLPDSTTPPTT